MGLLYRKNLNLPDARNSTAHAPVLNLKERLTFKYFQRLLQPGDLLLAPGLPLLVALLLWGAHLLELCHVLVDRGELRLHTLLVLRELAELFLEGRNLLVLVLHVLILCYLGELVLLRLLLVGRNGGLLHLEDTDDAVARTLCGAVRSVLSVVVLEHLD